MRALRLTLVLALVVTTLAIAPAPALAAPPPTGPMTIASHGFEGANTNFTTSLYPSPPPLYPQFFWGTNSRAKHSGAYSLWCAGKNGTADNSFMYSVGYDYNTSGWAKLSLPTLDEYYSAKLDFWYLLPSRGNHDTTSFRTSFGPTANALDDYHTQYSFPLVSSWTKSTYDLTAPDGSETLSRKDAVIKWLFVNFDEGGVTPTEGTGASIDDILVTGYKYGPVREITTTSTPTGVKLEWKRPYKALASSVLEERSISYRVWRQPQTAPTDPWTELTESGRITTSSEDVTYTDASAAEGTLYRYLVVVYDGGSGTGYGELIETIGRREAPPAAGVSLTTMASRLELAAGQDTTFTYTITNTGEVDITGLLLTDNGEEVDLTSQTLPAGETLVATRALTAPVDLGFEVFDAHVTGYADGTPVESSSSIGVQVHTPEMSVSVAPVTRGVSAGKQAAYRVSVLNTGDVALDLSGTITRGATPALLSATTVAPGSTAVLFGSVTAPLPAGTSSTVDVDVTGICGAGTSWQSSAVDAGSAGAVVVQDRFEGTTRTDTAVQLSRKAFAGGASTVVIATAYGYADALSASALAASVGGPLLLVRADAVPAEVLAELDRLNATTAYIIGGTAAVSDAAAGQLETAGVTNVVRLAGTTRYDTARVVSEKVKEGAGESTTVFLATGTNFPDALAASSLAAAMKAPIMLTRPTDLPAETLVALKSYAPTRVVVVGGTNAVSDGVLSTVRTQLGLSAAATPRLAGTTRYQTAKKIIDWGRDTAGLAPDGIDGMYLASGTNYPDALAGGVFAARYLGRWRPLMLANPTDTTLSTVPEVQMLVSENPLLGYVSAIGGRTALPETLYQKALGYVQ